MNLLTQLSQNTQVKYTGDVVSLVTILSAWLNAFSIGMTVLATTASFIWACLRIYETQTVQNLLKKRRDK